MLGAIGAIMIYVVQLVQLSNGDWLMKYSERESKTLEFKSRLPQFNALIKTCIAFANGFGGRIVIGVEDKTRKIIGITDADRERLYDEFTNSLYDAVHPTLFAHIWEKRFKNTSVLIIEVYPSPKKPYFLKSEGTAKGIYIRVGSNTRRANHDCIEDLIREGKSKSYDQEELSESPDILSKDLLRSHYGVRITDKRLLADRIIVPAPTGRNKYVITVAGALFFTEEPDHYVAEATIICTRFKGQKGRHIISSEEIVGPIDLLAEETLSVLCSWMERDYKLHHTKLLGQLPIPREALREAILNALIHKKYSIPGPIKIALYDNHCEIFNPGCFPGVVDLNTLGDGTTFLRNPAIGKLARKMGLVEKLGSGIRLIFDSCHRAKIRQPEYIEGADSVKLIFYFSPMKKIDKTDEQGILELINRNKLIKVNDVMIHLNISRNTASRRLNALIKDRKIRRTGKGPSVRYHLA